LFKSGSAQKDGYVPPSIKWFLFWAQAGYNLNSQVGIPGVTAKNQQTAKRQTIFATNITTNIHGCHEQTLKFMSSLGLHEHVRATHRFHERSWYSWASQRFHEHSWVS